MGKYYAIDPDMLAFYSSGMEQARLSCGAGLLEYLRTCELLARYLPQPPAVVLDVGGGPGAYALLLAMRGYDVHLIDPVPVHVAQARQASQAQPTPLRSIAEGDARSLRWPEASLDAVLLLGPLYHLPERRNRMAALREAHRVMRPRGVIFAAALSRFASTLDGLRWDRGSQPEFTQIVERAVRNGRRQNPPAYAHRPDELRREITTAGFSVEALVAVEGPGWLLPDVDAHLADPMRCDQVLGVLRTIEAEPSLMGASAHILAIGRRR